MSKAEKKTGRSELRDTIVVIIEALVIALLFRTFLYQPFSIPTGSLQPTMMIGDYFIANKFVWGFGKYSFPIPLPFNGRIMGREPNRGDIAVFRPVPQDQDYVKRVIGLPGDRIQMKKGRLHINGNMVERTEIGPGLDRDSNSITIPVTLYTETLPNGVQHTVQEISDTAPLDNTAEFVVPAGHFFMMGDNRDRSSDSRVLDQVGYVPAGNIIAKGEYRFFSITDNIAPWQIWEWPANVRWDRMFQSIY